jgi:hypothetical protein
VALHWVILYLLCTSEVVGLTVYISGTARAATDIRYVLCSPVDINISPLETVRFNLDFKFVLAFKMLKLKLSHNTPHRTLEGEEV